MRRHTKAALLCIVALAFAAAPGGAQTNQFGHFVYTAGTSSDTPSTVINGYSINGATGVLTPLLNSPFAAGDAVEIMAVHPSGNFLYALTTAGSGSYIAAFIVDAVTGGLTPVPGSPFAAGPSDGSQPIFPARSLLALDPSGKFLYAGNDNHIREYLVNAATGALTYTQTQVPGINALVVRPGGGYLYTLNNIDAAVVYSIDPTSGALTQVQTVPGCDGPQAVIESSGRFLYGQGNDITACQIDPTSGELTPVSGSPFDLSPGIGDWNMAAHPSGAFLYIVGLCPPVALPVGCVLGYTIDATTGALTAMENSPFPLPNVYATYAYGISVEPHGNYLYVTDLGYGVASYSINQTTGELTLASDSFLGPGAGTILAVGNQNLWDPGLAWPAPAAITYGTALSDTQLDATGEVPGVFTYSPAADTVLTAGSHTLSVAFVPNDTTEFTDATASVTLTVNQATPTINWAAPAAITYGTALSATQLSASSPVAGSFTYSPAAGSVPHGGLQTLKVTFTPTDSANYTTATATVTLTVNQATPTITWATPAAITYGAALGSAQLNASSSLAGTFAYSPGAGAVLRAGQQTLTATFIPNDTTDYASVAATVVLTVNQATPTITWPTPPAISYGAALGATQLDATSSAVGSFAYSPAAGTVLGVGSQTLKATFTPTDSIDYTIATATAALTVNQATPTINWPTPAAISYGTALGAAQLDATSPVAGTFTYLPIAGTVLGAGSQVLKAMFAPTDTTDYTTAAATIILTVNQATPATSWPTPAAIAYGTALGAAQLDATSPVAGTFTYSPAAGSVLAAGTQTLKAAFTPTDTTDYAAATATVTLTVNESTPAINWPTPAAITYGAGLGAAQLDATSPVAGSFSYLPVSGTVLGAGSQTLKATFMPTDTSDYSTATATITLTVNQATPTINWPTPAAITYGSALTATQLNATASVPGTFVYNPALGALPPLGNDTLSVTFTPADNIDYSSVTDTVTLAVNVQPNPVPFLGDMTPAITDAGGPAFTITVNGSGFLANSTVYWGTSALTTQFVSSTQLTATVTAADIVTPGATAINVQTPSPGGGTSDVLQFEVDSPSATSTAPTVPSTVVTVTAGSTATYSISFPASVTNATATCLNLPVGAICSYSFATGVLTISTSSTTPSGTYQVTVVFAETVASSTSAFILLPFLLLPLFFLRKKLTSRTIWPVASLSLILLVVTAFSIGCGGSSSPPTTTQSTQSVTSSGVVGMVVK